MGAESKIEWTTHTFNPWRGCTKVSAGCKHCYAETMSKRNPAVLGAWGPRGRRTIAADGYWRQPLAWDRAAAAAGERHRVFCASLADVFEAPETMPVDSRVPVAAARLRLFRLIRDTPHLDWLLLTKRPAYAAGWLDRLAWYADGERGGFSPYLTEPGRGAWYDRPLPNLWIGTSVEDQAAADERIPHVLRIPAAVRFLSCEPLIGPVDLGRWVRAGGELLDWTPDGDAPPGDYNPVLRQWETRPDDGGIAWVIVGGESGHGARPMHPQWARSLRDQCQAAGVAFFMKQWGAWAPYDGEWIDAGMTVYPDGAAMQRIGKVAAGRLLDGREWSDVPTLRQEPR